MLSCNPPLVGKIGAESATRTEGVLREDAEAHILSCKPPLVGKIGAGSATETEGVLLDDVEGSSGDVGELG